MTVVQARGDSSEDVSRYRRGGEKGTDRWDLGVKSVVRSAWLVGGRQCHRSPQLCLVLETGVERWRRGSVILPFLPFFSPHSTDLVSVWQRIGLSERPFHSRKHLKPQNCTLREAAARSFVAPSEGSQGLWELHCVTLEGISPSSSTTHQNEIKPAVWKCWGYRKAPNNLNKFLNCSLYGIVFNKHLKNSHYLALTWDFAVCTHTRF